MATRFEHPTLAFVTTKIPLPGQGPTALALQQHLAPPEPEWTRDFVGLQTRVPGEPTAEEGE